MYWIQKKNQQATEVRGMKGVKSIETRMIIPAEETGKESVTSRNIKSGNVVGMIQISPAKHTYTYNRRKKSSGKKGVSPKQVETCNLNCYSILGYTIGMVNSELFEEIPENREVEVITGKRSGKSQRAEDSNHKDQDVVDDRVIHKDVEDITDGIDNGYATPNLTSNIFEKENTEAELPIHSWITVRKKKTKKCM